MRVARPERWGLQNVILANSRKSNLLILPNTRGPSGAIRTVLFALNLGDRERVLLRKKCQYEYKICEARKSVIGSGGSMES